MGHGRVAVTGTDRTTMRATMATSRQSKHTERKVDERGRRKGNFDDVCTFFFTLQKPSSSLAGVARDSAVRATKTRDAEYERSRVESKRLFFFVFFFFDLARVNLLYFSFSRFATKTIISSSLGVIARKANEETNDDCAVLRDRVNGTKNAIWGGLLLFLTKNFNFFSSFELKF